ncbi:MAG: replication-associated recombination protein A [Chloroflexi bacterium]|nr:replication-associated recombination protein A [Chloroflexota bacterium]
MTLFEHRRRELMSKTAPLSTRMRPRRLEEIVGQGHLLDPGRVLRGCIESDRVPSMILWGAPGSGKTTLARVIAETTRSQFETLSAVSSGVADIRKVVQQSHERLGAEGRRTILFVDEIHRFNRGQQDALLPHVEDGTIVLIGATTENPSFEVVGPLLSRCRVFTLNALSDDDIRTLIDRALGDRERGLAGMEASLDDDARGLLVRIANGDARVALDALELAVAATPAGPGGRRTVGLATVEDALQRHARYDRTGDLHYDTISAFIKSIRASDPDAALYWLARMVDAGEDPMFIARRLVISAAEDVGLADPGALAIAVACQQGVHLIGWPEGRILMAHTTVYLASAPKSNASYAALGRASADVGGTRNDPVPLHLRNPVTGLMRTMDYGKGYQYAHDFPGGFVITENLPENLRGHRYYFPTDIGREAAIRERLLKWWGEKYGEGPPKQQ